LNTAWNDQQLVNFRKNWPNLRNFDNSVLRFASLTELTGMAKQKISGAKLLTQTMAAHFEQLQNFPAQVEKGEDDCTGKVHEARFLRGFVGDARTLWVQAREKLGMHGLDPISNFEVVSMGLGDMLTLAVWAELHSPNSQKLSIRMLSSGLDQDSWRAADRPDSPEEFNSLQELKIAVATLDGAIQRVTPWNAAFKMLTVFLTANNFGEAELGSQPSRIFLLANFIDEVLSKRQKLGGEKGFQIGSRIRSPVAGNDSPPGSRRFETKNQAGTNGFQVTNQNPLLPVQ
jgi:hypothetical protein